MTEALELKNLKHAYNDTPILKNVTFSISREEFFVIIGPNGSGKTTLMKIMSGIERFQHGRLKILKRPFHKYSRKALARKMAFVPQTIPVDFPFTVMELVLMGRSPHLGVLGLEQREDIEIADQSMSFTGVKHLARRKIEQLSGGERQRVFIARAIAQEPKIILLDEPTAALDIAHQISIMDLMEKLKKEKGLTIIMVSHDVNLAAMYGDRLLILKDGNVVGIGTPGEILTYETLEKAYGCRLLVDESPLGAYPRITPVPGRYIDV
jgi:iron complex transport system ATP-binding protein